MPELLATIAIIAIICGIAIPSFFVLIGGRQVESAANELASDMRVAHSRASNQVGTNRLVTLNPSRGAESAGTDYVLSDGATSQNKLLPGDVAISSPTAATTLTFKSDGTVTCTISPCEIKVKSGSQEWKVAVSTTTSDIGVSRVS